MNQREVLEEFHSIIKAIQNDIRSERLHLARSGVHMAAAFLRNRRADYSITTVEYDKLRQMLET